MLRVKVAKGKYLCHICPCPDKCLVKILDSDLIPCSAIKIGGCMGLPS